MVNLAIVLAVASLVFSGYAVSITIQAQYNQPQHYSVSSDQIWSLNYGPNNVDDDAFSIINSSEGGYILAGSTWRNGDQDVLLLRIAESGAIVWVNTFGGIGSQFATEVIECSTGGFAVVGSELIDGYAPNALLIRTNAYGDEIWSHRYGGAGLDYASSVIESQSGGFVIVGISTSYGLNGTNCWLLHTDETGEALWNQTFGGDKDDVGYSVIEERSAEGFVVAGTTKSFGGGNADAWLIRTNAQGELQWHQTIGGYRNEFGQKLIGNRNGGFTLIGTTDNTPNQNLGTFVINFLANGTRRWETTFYGSLENHGYSIFECHDGSYVITGITYDWDNWGGFTNLWLSRLDAEGNHQWSKSYGGYSNDVGRSIIQAENGDFIVAGNTQSYARGGSDVWILRVPDTPPPVIFKPVIILPDFGMVLLGAILGIVVLIGTFLVYRQSNKSQTLPWITFSSHVLQRTCLKPRYIEDLQPILTGQMSCANCGSLNKRSNDTCTQCGRTLHSCFICGDALTNDDCVIFCPSCTSLAHYEHALHELIDGNPCPTCGLSLPSLEKNSAS